MDDRRRQKAIALGKWSFTAATLGHAAATAVYAGEREQAVRAERQRDEGDREEEEAAEALLLPCGDSTLNPEPNCSTCQIHSQIAKEKRVHDSCVSALEKRATLEAAWTAVAPKADSPAKAPGEKIVVNDRPELSLLDRLRAKNPDSGPSVHRDYLSSAKAWESKGLASSDSC